MSATTYPLPAGGYPQLWATVPAVSGPTLSEPPTRQYYGPTIGDVGTVSEPNVAPEVVAMQVFVPSRFFHALQPTLHLPAGTPVALVPHGHSRYGEPVHHLVPGQFAGEPAAASGRPFEQERVRSKCTFLSALVGPLVVAKNKPVAAAVAVQHVTGLRTPGLAPRPSVAGDGYLLTVVNGRPTVISYASADATGMLADTLCRSVQLITTIPNSSLPPRFDFGHLFRRTGLVQRLVDDKGLDADVAQQVAAQALQQNVQQPGFLDLTRRLAFLPASILQLQTNSISQFFAAVAEQWRLDNDKAERAARGIAAYQKAEQDKKERLAAEQAERDRRAQEAADLQAAAEATARRAQQLKEIKELPKNLKEIEDQIKRLKKIIDGSTQSVSDVKSKNLYKIAEEAAIKAEQNVINAAETELAKAEQKLKSIQEKQQAEEAALKNAKKLAEETYASILKVIKDTEQKTKGSDYEDATLIKSLSAELNDFATQSQSANVDAGAAASSIDAQSIADELIDFKDDTKALANAIMGLGDIIVKVKEASQVAEAAAVQATSLNNGNASTKLVKMVQLAQEASDEAKKAFATANATDDAVQVEKTLAVAQKAQKVAEEAYAAAETEAFNRASVAATNAGAAQGTSTPSTTSASSSIVALTFSLELPKSPEPKDKLGTKQAIANEIDKLYPLQTLPSSEIGEIGYSNVTAELKTIEQHENLQVLGFSDNPADAFPVSSDNKTKIVRQDGAIDEDGLKKRWSEYIKTVNSDTTTQYKPLLTKIRKSKEYKQVVAALVYVGFDRKIQETHTKKVALTAQEKTTEENHQKTAVAKLEQLVDGVTENNCLKKLEAINGTYETYADSSRKINESANAIESWLAKDDNNHKLIFNEVPLIRERVLQDALKQYGDENLQKKIKARFQTKIDEFHKDSQDLNLRLRQLEFLVKQQTRCRLNMAFNDDLMHQTVVRVLSLTQNKIAEVRKNVSDSSTLNAYTNIYNDTRELIDNVLKALDSFVRMYTGSAETLCRDALQNMSVDHSTFVSSYSGQPVPLLQQQQSPTGSIATASAPPKKRRKKNRVAGVVSNSTSAPSAASNAPAKPKRRRKQVGLDES